MNESGKHDSNRPLEVSNEYVLNVAFLSFLLFTTLQLFFAIIARSQAMMADCAAMYVDVMTYLFNFLAERLKHHQSDMPWKKLQLRRLLLELIPPFVSVATLVAVTVLALRLSVKTLSTSHTEAIIEDQPDLTLMLLFSAMNLLLDVLNVGCFARVDQAVGLPGQHGFDRECSDENYRDTAETELSETSRLVPLEEEKRQDDVRGLNLNMCSAWTHICADTLRSIAVLIAAAFAFAFPEILSPIQADAWGAIIVSVIILISLGPLVQGLFLTSREIKSVWCDEDNPEQLSAVI